MTEDESVEMLMVAFRVGGGRGENTGESGQEGALEPCKSCA